MRRSIRVGIRFWRQPSRNTHRASPFLHPIALLQRKECDTICSAPSSARGRPSALRAVEQTQRSSSFPRPIRSHGHRCPASRVKAALSKAAWWPWPLTFWPWKRCPSHCDVGYLCANFGLHIGLSVLQLSPMYATDRRQTKASLDAPPIRGWA